MLFSLSLKNSNFSLTNNKIFSYPGYNEILTGEADSTINSNAKIKLVSQSKGENFFPFSIVWYSSAFFKQAIWKDMQADDYLFSDQMSYVHQMLIARKITSALSVQLSPTLVHKNIVNQGNLIKYW